MMGNLILDLIMGAIGEWKDQGHLKSLRGPQAKKCLPTQPLTVWKQAPSPLSLPCLHFPPGNGKAIILGLPAPPSPGQMVAFLSDSR